MKINNVNHFFQIKLYPLYPRHININTTFTFTIAYNLPNLLKTSANTQLI